jgi:hypothetical protein
MKSHNKIKMNNKVKQVRIQDKVKLAQKILIVLYKKLMMRTYCNKMIEHLQKNIKIVLNQIIFLVIRTIMNCQTELLKIINTILSNNIS